eukprot:1743213-Amphidinium_carterae.1
MSVVVVVAGLSRGPKTGGLAEHLQDIIAEVALEAVESLRKAMGLQRLESSTQGETSSTVPFSTKLRLIHDVLLISGI